MGPKQKLRDIKIPELLGRFFGEGDSPTKKSPKGWGCLYHWSCKGYTLDSAGNLWESPIQTSRGAVGINAIHSTELLKVEDTHTGHEQIIQFIHPGSASRLTFCLSFVYLLYLCHFWDFRLRCPVSFCELVTEVIPHIAGQQGLPETVCSSRIQAREPTLAEHGGFWRWEGRQNSRHWRMLVWKCEKEVQRVLLNKEVCNCILLRTTHPFYNLSSFQNLTQILHQLWILIQVARHTFILSMRLQPKNGCQ